MGYSMINQMNQSDGGGRRFTMIGAAYSASPNFYPYDENGDYKDLRSWYSWSSHEIKNPLCMAYESTYKTVTNLTNINAALNFNPIKGLSIRTSFGWKDLMPATMVTPPKSIFTKIILPMSTTSVVRTSLTKIS